MPVWQHCLHVDLTSAIAHLLPSQGQLPQQSWLIPTRMTQISHLQAKQLAQLLSAHGSGLTCLVLDIREVEEHARCHIKGGAQLPPLTPTDVPCTQA